MKLSVAMAVTGVLAGCAPFDSTSTSETPVQRPPVALQFLSISDWHAQLDPLSVNGQAIGGAAVLASYFQADRAANPNTLTLTAGDAFGASPPLSGFFDETPAVRALGMMGIDVDTFGNHNFDRGTAFLQTKIDEAAYPFVDANLQHIEQELTGVAPFAIFDVGGIKVGVVGITNPDAPELLKPGSLGSIVVGDPIPAANAARAHAQAAGAQVTVAIVHMGITGVDPATGLAFGPLVDFANNVGGFDFIFGDHTDFQYSGVHNNALVVENKSKGRTYARVTASVQPTSGHVDNKAVTFVTPDASAVTPDQAIVDMLAPYRAQLSTLKSVVVGQSSVAIPRADSCGNSAGRLCESKIGNVIADAMRFETAADFAITNSGGIRADLTCPTTDLATDFCPPFVAPPYPITNGQVLTVLPFGNVVVQASVTGAELRAMLENGVSQLPGVAGRFPQVSGLCATFDISLPAGSRITSVVRQAADGSCTGAAVDLSAASTYLVMENDFMAVGGDGYPNVASRMTTLDFMDGAVIHYLGHQGTINPTIQGRLVCTSSGAVACPVQL